GHVTGVQTCALPIFYFEDYRCWASSVLFAFAPQDLAKVTASLDSEDFAPLGEVEKGTAVREPRARGWMTCRVEYLPGSSDQPVRSEERRVGKEGRWR